MAILDSVGAFKARFTPIEGGYLYYPSRRSGGKLVTQEEYERLLSGWLRIAGTRGRWLMVAATTLVILAWTFVSPALPHWCDGVFTGAVIVLLVGIIFWVSFAPSRLVAGRPDIAPPRSLAEAKKEIRALFSWRMVFAGFSLGILALINGLAEAPGWSRDGWLAFGLLLAGGYLRISFKKWRDEQPEK